MELTCMFSGHRPEKLPWGRDESDPRCLELKRAMKKILGLMCQVGILQYLCGMARGTDLYFAEALLELREEYPLTLTAVVPCKGQSDFWSLEEQRRHLRILGSCDRSIVLEEHYSAGTMLRRNRYMVEHADILMAYWDGGQGGTGYTCRYAAARGLAFQNLHPGGPATLR